MYASLAERFARFFRAFMPDPLVLAVGLSAVVFALCWWIQGQNPLALLRIWNDDQGLWSLLGFTMQMILVLVTGHAVADAPSVQGLLRRLAALPRTGRQAVWMVASVSMVTASVNWGLGLIVGALLARSVGVSSCAERSRYQVHYPLLCAAGYMGLLNWHGGLSGTAPLMMTTEVNVHQFLGEGFSVLPFTKTVLGKENALISGGLVVLIPLLLSRMSPASPVPYQTQGDPSGSSALVPAANPSTEAADTKTTLADWLEGSRVLGLASAGSVTTAAVVWWLDKGFARLDPNALNLSFVALGLVLHGNLRSYRESVQRATAGIAGILIQFPLYAGILGMMRHTGLGATLASWVGSASNASNHSLLTMLAAACINLFVPSGGGQWAVQGPVALASAHQLGVPTHLTVLAVAYGDQLTNMLQPFWALPLLAITGVRARDILGYTALTMLAAGAWCGFWLVAFSVL